MESTAYLGSDETSGPFRWVWEHLFGTADDDRWMTFHHIIRKTGHFFGYGILGLFWLRAWWRTLVRTRFLILCILGLLGTFVVASADELHQSFLPNRTGLFSDVLLDCSGALVLQSIVYLYLRIYTPQRLSRVA